MRRTVSRLIRHVDGYLRVQIDGMFDDLHRLRVGVIGRVPKRDYVVTYTVSPRARRAVEPWRDTPLAGISGQPVCFLPREWVGRRVRRTVRTKRAR